MPGERETKIYPTITIVFTKYVLSIGQQQHGYDGEMLDMQRRLCALKQVAQREALEIAQLNASASVRGAVMTNCRR